VVVPRRPSSSHAIAQEVYRLRERGEKEMTPTDRLSDFGTSLATRSDSVERVPRGHG
jgi:hypothetical protein